MPPFTIAITGKGGTGKTTVAALLVSSLVASRDIPILAVDADPNANLHEALGVPLNGSLGGLREQEFTRQIPAGLSRTEYIRLRFHQVLTESAGFDLIAMGRPEGAGCYCFANDLLSASMRLLERDYRFIIVDNEAGMEHISRGTLGIPDALLVVSDPSSRGIRTALRIRALAKDFGLQEETISLIVNRALPGAGIPVPPGWPILIEVPEDPHVTDVDISGNPLVRIPPDSPARAAIARLAVMVRNWAAAGSRGGR